MEKKDSFLVILALVIVLILASLTIPILVRTTPEGIAQQNPPRQQQLLQQAGLEGPPLQTEQKSLGADASKQLKTADRAYRPLVCDLCRNLPEEEKLLHTRPHGSYFCAGMYAITSCPLIISLAGDIGFFQILPDLCTTVALVVLGRISLE